MQFRKVVLASFLALSLVACGDKDDNKDKPDDNKPTIPEKDAACVAAGDKCQLVDGKWVIKGDGNNGGDAPVVNSPFDYSDIGVTDKLDAKKRGFGFYHKGEQSKLDDKVFTNTVTLSPAIPWSSTSKYDEDLWNFVAIRLHDASDPTASKGKMKFMFDEIGKENQRENKNIDFFGKTAVAGWGEIGKSSFDPSTGKEIFTWNRIPAVVNTFMWKDADENKYNKIYVKEGIWHNEEADPTTGAAEPGTGGHHLRVYGRNAFLVDSKSTPPSKAGDFIMTSGKVNDDAAENKFNLKNRPADTQFKHANFVFFDSGEDREAKAFIKDDGTLGNAKYIYTEAAKDKKKPFPTDVKLGELKYAQFGRLTGQGINPDAAPMTDKYDDDKLRPYNFSGSNNVVSGNTKAEDWYFGRGIDPTPASKLENLKEKGAPIMYRGQAVMFGLDYSPAKRQDNKPAQEKEDDKSTNSVMPKETGGKFKEVKTVLDGKQNFVNIEFDPATGHLKGKVFGVWTWAKFLVATEEIDATKLQKGWIVPLTVKDNQIIPNVAGTGVAYPTTDATVLAAGAKGIIDHAIRIGAKPVTLVDLHGAVLEGTNGFSGEATKLSTGNKGVFMGGFFGNDASEIAGVIDSQTGNMKNKDLQDPGDKWGGSFGAQAQIDTPVEEEYLDFPEDKEYNYDTATEVF